MSPAVTPQKGMCRSKALVYVIDGEKGKKTGKQKKTVGVCLCVCVIVEQLRFSQGHPLSYDIHGARPSLSDGHSPSAPTDKNGYFMCS